ncbi:MAG: MOSC N-terminal beta barrel domain-containing protein [Shimia thalassica]|uniref:MOSC domain-containing protein n=1 Tax=Shimia thalassica TaxID=1715693 RepID=UPI000C06FA4B|nr:MOSC N-terminal beta barrel domain-containing protein [Shimia thalassica]MDO6484637.1 MOSC domain-containing protein [Shimia thalassica]PHO04480.1 molybdenum cofactor biosysynthesis protein [Rhodobacteraceae bacterium 4F10]
MSATVAALWRHPIKSHGRESLDRVSLSEGQTMPWDRRWAVTHESAKTDGSDWAPCMNFSRGAKAPSLMAISAKSDETSGIVTLSHPELSDLSFDPDGNPNVFLEWVRPIMPENRAQSAGIVRVADRGMTDTDFPSISLLNLASNEALSAAMQTPLSMDRWRGNIILDGLNAWEEKNWPGKTLRIGDVELEIREEITRCLATTANPETGVRDADTLKTLSETFGHREFGVYGVVTKGGDITVGDKVEVI